MKAHMYSGILFYIKHYITEFRYHVKHINRFRPASFAIKMNLHLLFKFAGTGFLSSFTEKLGHYMGQNWSDLVHFDPRFLWPKLVTNIKKLYHAMLSVRSTVLTHFDCFCLQIEDLSMSNIVEPSRESYWPFRCLSFFPQNIFWDDHRLNKIASNFRYLFSHSILKRFKIKMCRWQW